MELFVADLIERFYTALWPFLRIGAMLMLCLFSLLMPSLFAFVFCLRLL